MNRLLILFLLLLTGLRLYIGAHTELSPDEAYYYQWSERMDWAFYSKGPGVAAAIKIGTWLFGPTELGVRFLSPLLSLGTSLLIFAIARRLYSESVATWAVIFINLVPIFQAGSMVMTIDALSIYFWAAALYTFWLALERSPRFSLYWPLTGLLMGLGFLAKYTNAMELVSVVLVLLLTAKFRSEFKRPGFYILLLAFSLAIIPPLVWNYQHDWVTVQHLKDDGGLNEGSQFRPLEILVYLGIHLIVYSPLIFGAMAAALYWGCRDAKSNFKTRFLLLFALPLILLYFSLSILKAGQPNWTAPAFVSLGILAVAYWHKLAQEKAWSRRYVAVAFSLGLLMSLALVNSDTIRRLGYEFTYDRDPSARLRGWKTVAIALDGVRKEWEAKEGVPLFLIAERYQTASSLAFYLPEKRAEGPGHPSVYVPETQAIINQYAFWPRYDELLDPIEQAEYFLKEKQGNSTALEALGAALAGVKDPSLKPGSDVAVERRHALIRALLAVDPTLPLDVYASEEVGISRFYGRNALYVNDSGGNRIPTAIEKGFEKVELVALWSEERRGLPLRTIRVYLCRNYRSLPL